MIQNLLTNVKMDVRIETQNRECDLENQKRILRTAPRQLNIHNRKEYSAGEVRRDFAIRSAPIAGRRCGENLGQEAVRCVANQNSMKGFQMKLSAYKSYDDLPLFLNAVTVAKVLGVSPSSGYELMHEKDFPVLRVGNRMVVPKEKFVEWVERHRITPRPVI